MKSRSLTALCGALVAFVLVIQAPGLAQMRKPTGVSAITAADMKEWLSYIASDQLQGRQVYTEGLGLAGVIHRRTSQGVGREAGRRRRHLLPGRQGSRRQRQAQLDA